MIRRRAQVSLLVAVLVAGGSAASVSAAPGAVAVATSGPVVTLVTGDRVTFGGMDGVEVRAAKGREHLAFHRRKGIDGDILVIPEDALAPLSQGRLDPRLFDVTRLVRDGYDDAHRPVLPLIVDFKGRTSRAAGAETTRELPAMSAAAVNAERNTTFWATAKNAEHVWLDGPVKASLDHSVPQIGAPDAWAAGYTGAGTTVAVLDTGIDVTHPDLADAVVGAKNFTDSDNPSDNLSDNRGHGTHVASIITGSGAASGGRYRGVAPDADLLNAKVLDDTGGGQESWIIAGMEWAAGSGADVINMSLGSSVPSDGTDPMSQAVNRLTADTGALFVIAAGNSGGRVTSPAAADAALTVGAVDRDDQLAGFSSRGRDGGGIKPDITAPGVDIVAAKAKNGQVGTPAADGYVTLSGTSMATPHVAGAAAILAGAHPDWTAAQLKPALTGTAKPTGGVSVFDQGAGRVDVAKAVTATVFAAPASIDNGTVQWPHDDDQTIANTVTYTNFGAEPVTLDLAADVTGGDGSAAPQGMVTVSPAELTVPAGGQASATVTTDTRVDAADGQYGGAVVATGAGQSVRTPIAVRREAESYDVTVHAIDNDGAPTGEYWFQFVDVNNPEGYVGYDPSGTVVARVPKGEYFLDSWVQTENAQQRYDTAVILEPSFPVTGDTAVTLDARQARQVGFHVDKPNAKVGSARWRYTVATAWGDYGTTTFLPDFTVATFRPSVTSKPGRLTFSAEARMGEWNGTSFDGSPYLYSVRHTEDGRVPQTLDWTFHDSDLAKVRSEHAAATSGVVGYRENFLVVPLPGKLTEYYTPDVPWDGQFLEMADPATFDIVSAVDQVRARSFPRGRTTTERWNVGVFNPALPTGGPDPWQFAARLGDQVRFVLPMFVDQGQGRAGFVPGAVGTTTLLRDGVVVGESSGPGMGFFTVDPSPAEYTLRTTADRSSHALLSTQVSAEWTYFSEHVPGESPALLPLLAIRFAPTLDDHNAAPAGRRFTIPVYVQRNGSDDPGQVHTPTVDVSYDDGKTWQHTRVNRTRDGWQAVVNHPSDAEFVSLRSGITDPDGNTQHQTIIRAYALS